jgi:hypothetical protein
LTPQNNSFQPFNYGISIANSNIFPISSFFAAIELRYNIFSTFPTLNILLYNTLGGSGDELYGVEPPSYYIRNLFLNLGIAWPLGAAAPILLSRAFLEGDAIYKAAVMTMTHPPTTPHPQHEKDQDELPRLYFVDPEREEKQPLIDLATIFSSAVLWLAVLFKRPHKV